MFQFVINLQIICTVKIKYFYLRKATCTVARWVEEIVNFNFLFLFPDFKKLKKMTLCLTN
jgi:hypothetical protein